MGKDLDFVYFKAIYYYFNILSLSSHDTWFEFNCPSLQRYLVDKFSVKNIFPGLHSCISFLAKLSFHFPKRINLNF